MNEPQQPLFLARDSYRQRRTTDAARLLPILGFLALCLPILWGGEDGRVTSNGIIYLFVVWIGLIIAAVLLARRLGQIDQPQDAPDESG